jgi:hypothetical protein
MGGYVMERALAEEYDLTYTHTVGSQIDSISNY